MSEAAEQFKKDFGDCTEIRAYTLHRFKHASIDTEDDCIEWMLRPDGITIRYSFVPARYGSGVLCDTYSKEGNVISCSVYED